jgi:hypothetical protein
VSPVTSNVHSGFDAARLGHFRQWLGNHQKPSREPSRSNTSHKDHRIEHSVEVVTGHRGFGSMFLNLSVPNGQFFAPALLDNFPKRQFKLLANELFVACE